MKKIALPYAIALFIVSCNDPASKEETATPVIPTSPYKEMGIEKNNNNWGADIILHIQKAQKISAEITAFKIISGYKGKPVGFDLVIKRPLKKSPFIPDGITFRSLKDTSNNFLAALAEVYGLKIADPVFTDSLTIPYADLTADIDLNKPGNWTAAQMKLFFETEDDNYELYLNIDEKTGTISLPEKDGDYREGIIKALSKKAGK